ncbi:MAG: AGE family epimerase/isomerase [Cyclonatronaceae bacterium]
MNTTNVLQAYRKQFERELFDHVIPFWERHSPDPKHGGYFDCLDRDGNVYDTRKHMWLQGRQAWMFSTLYRTVEQKKEWLDMAASGIRFLREHAVRDDGRVYFSMTADGRPVYLQRKIFSECFFTMALAGYAHATGENRYLKEAEVQLARIWEWSKDFSKVGRPPFEGEIPAQALAIPMILLNLIEEVTLGEAGDYRQEVDECIRRMRLHVHADRQLVFETVAPDGSLIDNTDGRFLNPGHAIEAGWFLQHWAQRLGDRELMDTAADMVRWSFRAGWDQEHGGIYYFLDSEGYSPVPLEWSMKLWWPHCEAMYAHLLNFKLSGKQSDWQAFAQATDYSFAHFPDHEFGEWYGYLDRYGNVTHRFKGGPYKGCFHVPRALWLCWNTLRQMETS